MELIANLIISPVQLHLKKNTLVYNTPEGKNG